MKRGALLDLILTKEGRLIADASVEGSLGFNEHKMVEFMNLTEGVGQKARSQPQTSESRL